MLACRGAEGERRAAASLTLPMLPRPIHASCGAMADAVNWDDVDLCLGGW